MELRSGTRTLPVSAKRLAVEQTVQKGVLNRDTRSTPRAWPNQIYSSASRKRTHSQSEATGALQPLLKRARLTFANLRDHTAEDQPTMPGRKRKTSPPKAPPPASTATSRTTTTDTNFAPQLRSNHVEFRTNFARKPSDVAEIKARLDRERLSPAPDEELFCKYQRKVGRAANELEIEHNALPYLSIAFDDDYRNDFNCGWVRVVNEVTNGISPPEPDVGDSWERSMLPQSACDALKGALCPAIEDHPCSMPRLCWELKGPNGSLQSAVHQCAYDGAVMVHAAKQVHDYLGKPLETFYNITQALTLAFNGEHLYIHTNHALAGPNTKYHQFRIHMKSPVKDLESFREAFRVVRNAQDWGKEMSACMISELRLHDDVETLDRAQRIMQVQEAAQTLRATLVVETTHDAPLAAPKPVKRPRTFKSVTSAPKVVHTARKTPKRRSPAGSSGAVLALDSTISADKPAVMGRLTKKSVFTAPVPSAGNTRRSQRLSLVTVDAV